MPSRLSLRNFEEFQKRCQDLEGVGTAIDRQLATHVPRAADAIWSPETALKYAASRLDRAALGGARVRASGRSVTMTGATSPRVPGLWAPVEFGAGGDKVTTYTRRGRKGGTHAVTRHTQRQLPARNAKGRVLYRSGAEAMRRFYRLIGSTVVRTIHETLEGK